MLEPTSLAEVLTLATRHVSEEAFTMMTLASATVLLQQHVKPQAQLTPRIMRDNDKK